jgi:hypothetical protein
LLFIFLLLEQHHQNDLPTLSNLSLLPTANPTTRNPHTLIMRFSRHPQTPSSIREYRHPQNIRNAPSTRATTARRWLN